jgi:hypothetical protein
LRGPSRAFKLSKQLVQAEVLAFSTQKLKVLNQKLADCARIRSQHPLWETEQLPLELRGFEDLF